MPQHHFSKEESASRGHKLYEQIRSQVEKSHRGKVVAIDLITGAYEVASNTVNAARRLRARYPETQAWFVRVGHQTLYHFGSRSPANPR